MNVLLVSECGKRALTETRRILDQFAERRGDRVWQTPITLDGLAVIRKLLRKKARKNTAVACHWIRGLNHSELLWIVGDASRFNVEGAVPTNTTIRNLLRSEDENDWHTAQPIRLLAQMAALLHDLGKASVAFQQRIRGQRREANLYRHEWVSLRLFGAFVAGDNDEGWLTRLSDPNVFDEQQWTSPGRYQRDGLDENLERYPFRSLQQKAPLAAAVGWLVVTHHRLPVIPVQGDAGQNRLGVRCPSGDTVREWLKAPLDLFAHDSNEKFQPADRASVEPYWQLDGPLPVVESKWRVQAARLANSLLIERGKHIGEWLNNPYVMHLARLSLMLADHYYSSLPPESSQRVKGGGKTVLHANTDSDGRLKQPLDEHLLGVARDAGLIVHALPGFERHLPRLARHRGLRKRSVDPGFAWQDKAADAAAAIRDHSSEHGAFIVNMASTGCGKTLANARILYGLADPHLGLRATYALGLRTLTLQTGRSYRTDLQLNEDELAIQVGGSANRNLFEFYETKAEATGSASSQQLIEEDSHVLFEGNIADHPLLSRAMHNPDICKLLSAPILVCTVDHLVPATESLRAGRQIAPMLRLISADLVLDELDDYDLDDLPALTRLVHWAGMLGTRIVLSSATLPPSLVTGMYLAYKAGRQEYRRNRGRASQSRDPDLDIPCLWIDEFGVQPGRCRTGNRFQELHMEFVTERARHLVTTATLRRGELLPLDLESPQRDSLYSRFANHVLAASLRLHSHHAESDPVSGKRVSFGLVRMANIDPIFNVARRLFELGAPEHTRIHLCVYHARFPLLQRSAIEHMLDAAFNRRDDDQSVYHLREIREALDTFPEGEQLFVVLASPVCEVGRDWDADWAVAEPSSMRSLIQLAGRVQRHRRREPTQPNVLIFDSNLLSKKGEEIAFARPGFENSKCKLKTHSLHELLTLDEYRTINALPRIKPREPSTWKPSRSFVDLEHARMAASMLPPRETPSAPAIRLDTDTAFAAWRYPSAGLTGVLTQQQPFRNETMPTATLVFLPDEDEEGLHLYRVEESYRRNQPLYVEVESSHCHTVDIEFGSRISAWGAFDLMTLLREQAEFFDLSLERCAQRMTTVEVPVDKKQNQGWWYHSLLGFVQKK